MLFIGCAFLTALIVTYFVIARGMLLSLGLVVFVCMIAVFGVAELAPTTDSGLPYLGGIFVFMVTAAAFIGKRERKRRENEMKESQDNAK